MAIATYQGTIDAGQEPDRKATAEVDVDGAAVQVTYWPSLITQWGAPGVRAYVEAEALFAAGAYADALAKLAALATGSDTRAYATDGTQTGADTRNWAQRWVDEHPVPAPVQPVVDPLA